MMQDVCTVKNPVIRCSSQVKSFITRMQCFSVCTTPLIARIHHIPFEAYQLLKTFNIKPILYIDAPSPLLPPISKSWFCCYQYKIFACSLTPGNWILIQFSICIKIENLTVEFAFYVQIYENKLGFFKLFLWVTYVYFKILICLEQWKLYFSLHVILRQSCV